MKKMKRFLVALLSSITAIACVAGLAACNDQSTSSSSSSSSEQHVHSGGQATCTAKAECACGEEYGELGAHVWGDVIAEQSATCTVDGVKAHYDCANCDAVSLDGTTATTESLVLTAPGHNWEEVAEVPATCTVNGTEAHFACDCGALAQGEEKTAVEAADLVIVAAHDWEEKAEVPATCTVNGTEAHFDCKNCDALAQGADKTAVEAADLVIVAAHVWGEEIAEVPATCTVNGTEAYFDCANCDVLAQGEEKTVVTAADLVIVAAHVWVGHDAKEATCTEDGWVAHFDCENCEAQSLDRRVEVEVGPIPAFGHTAGVFVPGVNADCENDGYIGHFLCETCEATVDAENNEIDPTIAKLAHANLVNAYDFAEDYLYDLFWDMVFEGQVEMPDDVTMAEAMAYADIMVMMTMKELFPNGRVADGHYCDFGLVCADCFDLFAWAMGEEEFGYVTTGLGHFGGEADCDEGAYCERCGIEYTDPDETQHYTVNERQANCYQLAICDDCFQEYGEFNKEVEGHSFVFFLGGTGANCFEAETYPIYKCENCDQYAYQANGEYVMVDEYVVGDKFYGEPAWNHKDGFVAATCVDDAYCTVCGKSGAELNQEGAEANADYLAHHVWGEEVAAKAAGCGVNGVSDNYKPCVNCDKALVLEDETVVDETTLVVAGHSHTIVPATCTADAYCDCEEDGCVCEATGRELGDDKTAFDEYLYEAHCTWTLVPGKQPTCTEGGWKGYYKCSVCGTIDTEDGQIPVEEALGHKFLNAVAYPDAVCPSAGEVVYLYICDNGCGAHSLTANSQQVATAEQIAAAFGHVWNFNDAVPMTCLNGGTNGTKAHYECEYCEAVAFLVEGSYNIVDASELVVAWTHVWGEEVAEQAAGCQVDGWEAHYICTVCQAYGQGDDEIVVVDYDTEIKIAATGEHVCADSDRYCSDMLVCDDCHTIYDRLSNASTEDDVPADHVWDEEDECKYCDKKNLHYE